MKPSASICYLDHNATTPIHPSVIEAMLPYLREHFGNPSSNHIYGQRAKQAITRAREQVAGLLACHPDEIIFTSGGTEANNLAIRGVIELAGDRRHVVTSTVEHPATARPCELLERHGIGVTRLPVDSAGRLRIEMARAVVRGNTALVTVMLAQNETGTLMPIAELAGLTHEMGALVHTDAAQAVGRVPTRTSDLGVDLLSIAGHKLYAPKGVGALYIRRGVKVAPIILGAGHEHGVRPGTENVVSIVGLGAACAMAARDLAIESDRQRGLRDRLWELLGASIPGLVLNGHVTERLPNTLNVTFPGTRGSAVLAATPEVAASTGSACHEGCETASSVLTAMGVDGTTALGAVRLSLGRSTIPEQVEQAASALTRGWRVAVGAE